MKKTLIFITIALISNIAYAQKNHNVYTQKKRKPILDITLNRQSWTDRQANVCVQLMPVSRLGLCFSGNFTAAEGSYGNFFAQNVQWVLHGEVRFFPFGAPYPVNFKSKLRSYDRKRKNYGCFGTKDNLFGRVVTSLIDGMYIASGYIYQNQNLNLSPQPEIESPLNEFKYNITSKGGTLALGCQLRFWHLTLGAGWGIQITQPHWTGPVDIFGDDLHTTTFPWKLNIQQGPRFEVGINF